MLKAAAAHVTAGLKKCAVGANFDVRTITIPLQNKLLVHFDKKSHPNLTNWSTTSRLENANLNIKHPKIHRLIARSY
jgi:hypothetical protein